MTFEQVIRAAIPDAGDDVCEHILWARTPFPAGKVSARGLYKAASQWRRACANDRRLCDHCSDLASPGEWECENCRAVLYSNSRPPQ